MELPPIPATIANFIPYLEANPHNSIHDLLTPYKAYEGRLRELYAQHPDNPFVANPHVNTTPLFAGHENAVTIRARNLARESDEEADKYLLALPEEYRKANGSPAVVSSMEEFKTNFNLFSESSLVGLDWSNVVAAG